MDATPDSSARVFGSEFAAPIEEVHKWKSLGHYFVHKLEGGLVVCVSPKDPYAEVLSVAKKVGPKFLFCDETKLGWAKQLDLDLGSRLVGKQVVAIAIDRNSNDLFNYDHKNSAAFLAARIPVACEDLKRHVAIVTMSSGSTGHPKAVPATHYTFLVDLHVNPIMSSLKLITGANVVYGSSLQHISARILQFGALASGYNLVILADANIATYLSQIERFKAPVIYAGAGLLHSLINFEHLENYDLTNVVSILPVGSEITFREEFKKFLDKHKHVEKILNFYGSSEVGITTDSFEQTPDEFLRSHRKCGRPIAGSQFKIVDLESGELLDKNQKGIIHIRSETMFPGYFDCLAETPPFVWQAADFDADNFFVTGDIGLVDGDGNLHVFGRQKELIIGRSNRKILPQELELVICEHSAVSSACVIGVEFNFDGGRHCPRAFVVPKRKQLDGELNYSDSSSRGESFPAADCKQTLCSLPIGRQRLLAEQLLEFVHQQVGWDRQLTGGIVFLDELPTLASGKIDKNQLRQFGPDQVEIFGNKCTK